VEVGGTTPMAAAEEEPKKAGGMALRPLKEWGGRTCPPAPKDGRGGGGGP